MMAVHVTLRPSSYRTYEAKYPVAISAAWVNPIVEVCTTGFSGYEDGLSKSIVCSSWDYGCIAVWRLL